MPSPFPHFSVSIENSVNPKRVRTCVVAPLTKMGPVVYWMGRDRRLHDNWALRYAQELAQKEGRPLLVLAFMQIPFLNAIKRQYEFSLEGFRDLDEEARERGISFHLQLGDPSDILKPYLERIQASALVMDLTVLRFSRQKRSETTSSLEIPVYEVDTHNIVPVWVASDKKEYAAYTLRPKIHRLLPEFLTRFPQELSGIDQYTIEKTDLDALGSAVSALPEHPLYSKVFHGTRRELNAALTEFIDERSSSYDESRNDPCKHGQSGLSPYLHFGFLSPQRLALEVMKNVRNKDSRDAFLEELVVRRELSDNFCFYEQGYDTVVGFPSWARKTLDDHRSDPRDHIYDLETFREARTHDALWNAAQKEMLTTGKMHGYMRMYWAKKIFEWTSTPEEAMRIAIELNDTYELDGRDPNGYTGIAWSIGGVHDRAWFPREIFGLIRYMSASGAKGKFDTQKYIETWDNMGAKNFS